MTKLRKIMSVFLTIAIIILTIPMTAYAQDEAEEKLIYRTSVHHASVERKDDLYVTNLYAYDSGIIRIDTIGGIGAGYYPEQIGNIKFDENYLQLDSYITKPSGANQDSRVSVSFENNDIIVYTLHWPTHFGNTDGTPIATFYVKATELGLKSNPEIDVFGEIITIPFSENIEDIITPTEEIKSMYRLPIVADLFIDKGNGLGDYFEIDMSVLFNIDADGKILYTLIAEEDFRYTAKSECKFSLKSDGIQIKYDAPTWCNYPRPLDRYYDQSAVNLIYNTQYTLYEGCYMNVTDNGNKQNTIVNYTASGNLPANNMIVIKKGDKIGSWKMSPQQVIYTDEQGQLFVKNQDGTKNYFSDTIAITVNGVTLTKDVGNKYNETEPIITPTGDVNADGQLDVADVVMLQKWLLTELKDLPNWQAADMYKDDRLDVFDLCIMKRELLKGASI